MRRLFNRLREVRTVVVLLLLCGVSCAGAADRWMRLVGEIEASLRNALTRYQSGEIDDATGEIADSYFGIFENEKANMEVAVRRHLSLKKATELEQAFTDLRKAMSSRSSAPEIKRQITELLEQLKASAGDLDRKGIGPDS